MFGGFYTGTQDVAAGDGTTSVTVICGALLRKCLELLKRGVHPTVIIDTFRVILGFRGFESKHV